VASREPHSAWNLGDPSQFNKSEVTLPPMFVDLPLTRTNFVNYLAEINYMDNDFGKLMDIVDDNGIRDNSVIVYTSEQGNSFPFAKWTCYDAGVHTAFIVRWPNVVQAGSQSDAIVEYVDVVPTFLEMAGAQPQGELDGLSIVPVLKGEKTEHKQYTFSQMTSRGIVDGPEYYGIRAIADKKYRYIWNLTPAATFTNASTTSNMFKQWKNEGSVHALAMTDKYQKRPGVEFYDVENDPYCMTNLADDPQYETIMAEMAAELQKWMDECGDLGQETELKAYEHQYGYISLNEVLYVSPGGSGSKDGSSWENAASLSTAAELVNSAERNAQLWLKAGTYKRTESVNFDYLHIYGGFDGTESKLEERNWNKNLTILDGGNTVSPLRNTQNASSSISSIVDGVIIQNGLCPSDLGGGGIYARSGAQIRNCIIRNNKTQGPRHGGGLMCHSGDNIVVENTLFINNTSVGNGGAVQVAGNVTATFINCTFVNNESANPGGAIGAGNDATNVVIINSVAYNNMHGTTYSSYGQNADVNGGGKITSINSAVESTSTKFSDGDDSNHIALSRTSNVGFSNPTDKTGKRTEQSEIDEINSSSYALAEGSLCIDAGNDDYVSTIFSDLACNERIMGLRVDIGAYEYKSDVSFIPQNKIKSKLLSVFVTGRELYISGAKKGSQLCIYNTQGQLIHSMTVGSDDYDYITTDLPQRGIYFVTAGDDVVKIRY